MKPTMALKPLVFALAAVMAVAAQAGGNNGGHNGGHNGGNNGGNNNSSALLALLVNAGAGATVIDTQGNGGNGVLNENTRNNGTMDNSANGSQGNLGANVAAGDGNQQDNVAAIATADERFIFGSAVAVSSATQTNTSNIVNNFSTQNNANLTNSANNSSGNIGVNVTAGDFNQQKNNLAIAVSGGNLASAAAGTVQTSNNLTVVNDLSSVSTHTPWHHPTTTRVPVSNNSTVNDSIKYTSGNVGANVSAGVGNQQNNSMVISKTSM